MCKRSLIAILCLVPLVSSCLAMAGAAGAASVVGYIYYEKNDVEKDFGASFEKTWKATLEALRSLKYDVPKDSEHELDSGTLKLENLWVHVARHPGNTTRVTVRVGTFHTEEHARRAGLILEKIDELL